MKTDNIKILLDNGLQLKTVSKLTESQINVLAKRFLKEQATEPLKNVTKTTKTVDSYTVNPGGEMTVPPNSVVSNKNGKFSVEVMAETDNQELDEKFESKAQQKFFWARCNKTKDKSSKWCKWAEEFSDKTKNFKKLPEKLHPEKTVKVRKESYDQFLEDSIVEMVEKYINPSMTKSQLMSSINEKVNKSESFMLRKPKRNSMFSQDEGKEMKTMKRPIGRMFSLGEDTKEKERTKTREKEKDKQRKNPYEPKHNPAPKARKEFKEQEVAPSKPGTKEKTREKGPGKKNPFQPKHNPAPKAGKGNIPNWLTWNKLGVNLK